MSNAQMSIAYRFDNELGLIVVTAQGHVTIEDRATVVKHLLGDINMPESAPIFIDASGVTNAPALGEASRTLALIQLLRNRFQNRIAYWVTKVGLVTPFSLASFGADLGHEDVRTFLDRKLALQWLTTDVRQVLNQGQ